MVFAAKRKPFKILWCKGEGFFFDMQVSYWKLVIGYYKNENLKSLLPITNNQ